MGESMTDWQSRFRALRREHTSACKKHAILKTALSQPEACLPTNCGADTHNALVDQLAADVAAEVEHADKAVAMLVKSHLCLTPSNPRGCAVCSLLAIHAARRKVP